MYAAQSSGTEIYQIIGYCSELVLSAGRCCLMPDVSVAECGGQ